MCCALRLLIIAVQAANVADVDVVIKSVETKSVPYGTATNI